jgi:4-amino-4-deoxy-L-arabinose transferase-like glycosyltransferase
MLKLKSKHPEIYWLLGLSLINLTMHLLTNGQYGFHRDELYMIDCAKHIDFGYADMPPLTPWLARLSITFFGETLRGLRLLPAIISSAMVLITGLMAREMGGRLFSQLLAALTVMVSPVYLVSGTQFQTIPFDQFFWVIISYLLIRLIQTDHQRLWIPIWTSLWLTCSRQRNIQLSLLGSGQ